MSLRTLFSLLFLMASCVGKTIITFDPPLSINGQSMTKLVINDPCMTHMTRLRLSEDPCTGAEHIGGFHFYRSSIPTDAIVTFGDGFAVKPDRDTHVSQCHAGWVSFNGKQIDTCRKTFFPSGWADLESELGKRVQNAVKSGKYKLQSIGDSDRGNVVTGVLNVFADDMTIRVVFDFCMSNGIGRVNTMYPLLRDEVFDESRGSESSEGRAGGSASSSESGRASLTPSPDGSPIKSIDRLTDVRGPLFSALLDVMLRVRSREFDEQSKHFWGRFIDSVAHNVALDKITLRLVQEHQDIPVYRSVLIPLLYAIERKSDNVLSQLLDGFLPDHEIQTVWRACLEVRDPRLLAIVCPHMKFLGLSDAQDALGPIIKTRDQVTLQHIFDICPDESVLDSALDICVRENQPDDLAKLVISRVDARLKTMRGTTIVHEFVAKGLDQPLRFALACFPKMANNVTVRLPHQTALNTALSCKNWLAVRVLLEHKALVKPADLDCSDDRDIRKMIAESLGYNDLMLAAHDGLGVKEVEELIAGGIDPETKTPSGQTAAKIARSRKHRELAQYLEHYDSKKRLLAQADTCALCLALNSNFMDVFRQLLDRPDINPTEPAGDAGDSAVECAIHGQKALALEMMLDSCSKRHIVPKHGLQKLFERAAEEHSTTCIPVIVARMDDEECKHVVLQEVEQGNVRRLDAFLSGVEAGKKHELVNQFVEKDRPLLMHLIGGLKVDDISVVGMLLKHGVDVNACGLLSGFSLCCCALELAIARCFEKVACTLIEHGASVLPSGPGRLSPLHLAILRRLPAVVNQLLKNGADVNGCCSQGGMTPLMRAAMLGNATIVKMLLDKKADPNVRNDKGVMALAATNDAEVAELLVPVSASLRLSPELEAIRNRLPALDQSIKQLDGQRLRVFAFLTSLDEEPIKDKATIQASFSKLIRELRTLDFYSRVGGLSVLAYALGLKCTMGVKLLLGSLKNRASVSLPTIDAPSADSALVWAVQFNKIECFEAFLEMESVDLHDCSSLVDVFNREELDGFKKVMLSMFLKYLGRKPVTDRDLLERIFKLAWCLDDPKK